MKIKVVVSLIIGAIALYSCESDNLDVKDSGDSITNNDFSLTLVDELNDKVSRLEQRLFSDVNFSVEISEYKDSEEVNQWANYFADSSLVKVQNCNFKDENPWRYEFYFDGINKPLVMILEGVEGSSCWFNNEIVYRQLFYFKDGEVVDNVVEKPSETTYDITKKDVESILKELQAKL